MPRTSTPKPSTAAPRAASPRKGMRLHKIWLPDMNSPEFIEQARRDSLAIAASAEEKELMEWMDSISILNDLPPYDGDL